MTVDSAAQVNATDPNALEVAPGREREKLQGWIPALATEDEIRGALEKAFDYRGDITLTKQDGTKIEGYLYDRRSGKTLADSYVRVLPANGSPRVSVPFADIAALAFTGRDTAAGISFEAWIKKYKEKKAAGEKNIGLHPEALE
ncbi:MAG: hypothetical protein M3O09_09845 [Acidobacteriota bacterium]|nr:hypothetical protein [Acidobacteriota bacterium]